MPRLTAAKAETIFNQEEDLTMQFYETNLGKQFFNKQMPELILVLKDIAEVLRCPQIPAVNLPVEVPPDYLTEFYYGNLELNTKIYNDTIRQFTKDAITVQEKLKNRLSADDWELVSELNTLLDNRSCEETAVSFQTGFCTAMQMVAAGLSGTGLPKAKQQPEKTEAD